MATVISTRALVTCSSVQLVASGTSPATPSPTSHFGATPTAHTHTAAAGWHGGPQFSAFQPVAMATEPTRSGPTRGALLLYGFLSS